MTTTEYYDNGTLAADEEENEFDNIANMIHLLGFTMSVPFLIITFIIYTILPELRNIHGLTMRGYVCSLLGTSTILLAFPIAAAQGVIPQCLLTGYALCLPLTASYFWVNVMSFDIWWTFGGFGPLKISKSQHEKKKFIFYSIYVWGWATLLTTNRAIVDYLSEGVSDEDVDCLSCNILIVLSFLKYCLNKAIYSWYVYGPIGATLLCNMLLFILTIRKITRHNKDTAKHLDAKDSRRQDKNKQWFALYLKLFLLMGITFSLEIISWMSRESKHIELIKDIFVSYQGIMIFVMFICKRKILRLILKRCHCERANSLESSSRRSTHARSSQETRMPVPGYRTAESSSERF